MAFSENLDVFLADFGVACTIGAATIKAILDQPDQVEELGNASGISREYELTARTSDLQNANVARGSTVVIASQSYTVRRAPTQIADGAFSSVLMSKP